MKRSPSNDLQIQSLSQTTTTKEQVLDKISNSSFEELKGIVPEMPNYITKDIILDNATKILSPSPGLPNFSDAITEAIIKVLGRPVFYIRDSKPVLKGNDIEKITELVGRQSQQLSQTIKSIGRIETDYLPGYEYVGTGWLFDKDLIVTNRHVARIFMDTVGTTFRFKSFFGNPVIPRIDFLAEHENRNQAEFQIIECVYIAADQQHDIAIFRVHFSSNADYEPLQISDLELREREDVAVVGYPAYDSRATLRDDMVRIFDNIFDVKRFAPGKVMQLFNRDGIGVHDCTTLGGASGAAVISLESGKILGLHFAGVELKGNYFVTAPALKHVLDKIPRTFTNHFISGAPVRPAGFQEMVSRNCHLKPYTRIQVPEFKISGRMIAYASPDSTYAVTREIFDHARESILIGIYDLSAEHLVTQITDALGRGVSVSLMLDIDSEKERLTFDKLKRYGVRCVPAPSCASHKASYFSSCHEKVIVVDGKWTLIQSGNYSNNSIPMNQANGRATPGFKPGNRDMGIAIESGALARFFTSILQKDMELELAGPVEEAFQSPGFPQGEVLVEAPTRIPDPLFPSQIFNNSSNVVVQPVLSPDNYLEEVTRLLASAEHSIKIEQQYIRVNQPLIRQLLAAITNGIEVQIIVAPPIGDPRKTLNEISVLRNQYRFDVRMLSPQHFVHCHNKLIIVDDDKVLVSSQNWSDSAVSKNREAGVIIYDKLITQYYTRIFDADWTMSDHESEEAAPRPVSVALESLGLSPGKYILLDSSDIDEV